MTTWDASERKYSSAVIAGPVCNMLGLNWHEVVRNSGVHESRSGPTVTASEFVALWEVIEAQASVESLPRLIGERMAAGPAIPVLFAVSAAPDLETGVQRLSVFKNLFGPVRTGYEKTDTEFYVRSLPDNLRVELPPSFISSQIAFIQAKARTLLLGPIYPLWVSLPLPEAERNFMTDLFGTLPSYGPPEICYRRTDSRRPFISNDPQLWERTENDLRDLADRINHARSVSERVRAALNEMFGITPPTIALVCQRLGMSRSSLIRKLKVEGTSFQQVLDETRSSLAMRYLRSHNLSIQQISHLIGYTDNNAFQRAFKRWTGETPGQMRQRLRVLV